MVERNFFNGSITVGIVEISDETVSIAAFISSWLLVKISAESVMRLLNAKKPSSKVLE